MSTAPPNMAMVPRRPTREEVAHHEAGHVVAAYLTGFHVFYADVTIEGDEYAETPIEQDLLLLSIRVREERWEPPDEVGLIRQRCFIAAAGFGAEQVFAEMCGQAFEIETARLGALGDRKDVADLWGAKGGTFYLFAEEMSKVFRDPAIWRMVSDIARALLARGKLFADEVVGMLEESRRELQIPFRLFTSSHPALQSPTGRPTAP